MALDDNIKLFSQITLFQLMEPDAMRLLAFSAELKLLRAGDIVARAPGPLIGGQVLTRGSLAVFTEADQVSAPTRIIKAPALIGELALIADTSFTGSVLAREPSSVLLITRPVFHRVLAEYPRSAAALRAVLMARLQAFSNDLADYNDLRSI